MINATLKFLEENLGIECDRVEGVVGSREVERKAVKYREQLALLVEKGVEAWNQWRTENPMANIDLSATHLSNTNLNGVDLSGVNLNFANLSNANLSDTNLSYAVLSGTNLNGADLNNADLSGALLNFANLRDANLSGANLSGTNLSDGIQIDPKWKLVHKLVNEGGEDRFLGDVDLSHANLSGANFTDTSLIYQGERMKILELLPSKGFKI